MKPDARLSPGRYVLGDTEGGAIKAAYFSSSYSTAETSTDRIAPANKGFLEIKKVDAQTIDATFELETDYGAKVKGKYSGPLRHSDGRIPAVNKAEGLSLFGFQPKYLLQLKTSKDPNAEIIQGELPSASKVKTFLNLISAKTTFADEAQGNKEQIDILLKIKGEETFILAGPWRNPIPSQYYSWNEGRYKPIFLYFTNDTKYMKAPASFSDKDYEEIDTKGFMFEVNDEEVELRKGNGVKYVFFQNSQGFKGVLRIDDYFSPSIEEEITDRGSYYRHYFHHLPGGIVVSYKCEAVPVIPYIG